MWIITFIEITPFSSLMLVSIFLTQDWQVIPWTLRTADRSISSCPSLSTHACNNTHKTRLLLYKSYVINSFNIIIMGPEPRINKYSKVQDTRISLVLSSWWLALDVGRVVILNSEIRCIFLFKPYNVIRRTSRDFNNICALKFRY